MYWQYFCDYAYWDNNIEIAETSIRRFRGILGDEGYNMIQQELVKDLDSVVLIDTTVQIKNIKHPHDAYLPEKSRKELVKLNDTYALAYKRDIIKLWKYKDASRAKKRKKTLLGRLIRFVEKNYKTLGWDL